jgi:predicted metalloprotease with PDZ domain
MNLMPKGQADRAGLHAGDGILSYAGALVATIERLAQMEDEGDAATRTVTVEREGKQLSMTVQRGRYWYALDGNDAREALAVRQDLRQRSPSANADAAVGRRAAGTCRRGASMGHRKCSDSTQTLGLDPYTSSLIDHI